jgi:glycosyltransferase involved in cell wall biosynthesis
MACGTPVIGSAVGGIKFTVRDGETGYLVPANDPEAIADRVAHLYRHPHLLNIFSRQAIQRANYLFTWRKITQAVACLYEDVLAAEEKGVEISGSKWGVPAIETEPALQFSGPKR